MFYVYTVLFVVALTLKKMKMSLNDLIVAWASIRKASIRDAKLPK
jgi:hypothetical protein